MDPKLIARRRAELITLMGQTDTLHRAVSNTTAAELTAEEVIEIAQELRGTLNQFLPLATSFPVQPWKQHLLKGIVHYTVAVTLFCESSRPKRDRSLVHIQNWNSFKSAVLRAQEEFKLALESLGGPGGPPPRGGCRVRFLRACDVAAQDLMREGRRAARAHGIEFFDDGVSAEVEMVQFERAYQEYEERLNSFVRLIFADFSPDAGAESVWVEVVNSSETDIESIWEALSGIGGGASSGLRLTKGFLWRRVCIAIRRRDCDARRRELLHSEFYDTGAAHGLSLLPHEDLAGWNLREPGAGQDPSLHAALTRCPTGRARHLRIEAGFTGCRLLATPWRLRRAPASHLGNGCGRRILRDHRKVQARGGVPQFVKGGV